MVTELKQYKGPLYSNGRPKLCQECMSCAAEAKALCGNCLLKQGDNAGNYDASIQKRKAMRAQEEASGKFPHDLIQQAQLEAMDRPPPVKEQGLKKSEHPIEHKE